MDVEDLLLVELSGARMSNLQVSRAVTSIRLSVSGAQDEERGALVRAEADVARAADADGESEADERLYHGLVVYYVRLRAEYEEIHAPALVGAVWPYLRSGLIEHAARLRAVELKVPLSLDGLALVGQDGSESEDLGS